MQMQRTDKPGFDRISLASRTLKAAVATRAKAGADQSQPICIYGICEKLGVTVRFNNINMEGMYQRGAQPRIHLSARRPLPRRAFNCAHELGHHVFGHGSSIDELREDAKENPWNDPKEFLADTFAGFLMMPTIGLRRAFRARGWTAAAASPEQMFAVACEFGVGYDTLLTHLSLGVKIIPYGRAKVLKRTGPRAIRAGLLGRLAPEPLILADRHRVSTTIDAEVGTLVLMPSGTKAEGSALAYEGDVEAGRVFRAMRPGIVRATAGDWATFVRVAPKEYVGLAQFRHLEEDGDE
jgi:Zn-dependent peptidase ImmA (M78 family)